MNHKKRFIFGLVFIVVGVRVLRKRFETGQVA